MNTDETQILSSISASVSIRVNLWLIRGPGHLFLHHENRRLFPASHQKSQRGMQSFRARERGIERLIAFAWIVKMNAKGIVSFQDIDSPNLREAGARFFQDHRCYSATCRAQSN